MTNNDPPVPSAAHVDELEMCIAEHGFDHYQTQVFDLLHHAHRADAPTEIIEKLSSPASTEFERSEALMWLAQDWPYYERRLADLERVDRPAAIELVDAWRAHEDLRKTDADVRELWGSHRHLDAVREGVRSANCA